MHLYLSARAKLLIKTVLGACDAMIIYQAVYGVNQKPITSVIFTSDVSSIRCAGNNVPSSCLKPLSE